MAKMMMNMSPAMPKEGTEEYWRAHSDANTLTEAEAIKADKKRSDNALAVLKKGEEQRKKALAQLGADDEDEDDKTEND